MGIQTSKKQYIFPDGMAMEVSTDSGSSYTNVGVFAGGITITHNFDKENLESGNAGDVFDRVKNETLEVAPTALWTWDLEAIQKLSSGLYTVSNVAGTPVAGATQTAASGAWSYNKFIEIANQNGDGSAITVNSVTAGTDGLLVVDTDYYVGQNALGAYGIFIIDSASVTTESQDMVIDYDYTPSEGKNIESGATTTTLDNFIIRLRHYTDSALTLYDIEMLVYSSTVNSGLSLAFKGANEEGLNELTAAFTGKVDSTKDDGKGLFKLYVATAALTS